MRNETVLVEPGAPQGWRGRAAALSGSGRAGVGEGDGRCERDALGSGLDVGGVGGVGVDVLAFGVAAEHADSATSRASVAIGPLDTGEV
jgi:hypothetical protein